jgi:signal transduction histidine kinase
VRSKIVALLVSLTALWAFAAFVTVREGLNLLAVSTLDTGVAQPSVALLEVLQEERRTTQVYLAGNGPQQRTAMLDARARTDAAIINFRQLANSGNVKFAGSDALFARIQETFNTLDSLSATERTAIDAGRMNRDGASTAYTGIIDSIFHIYDSMAAVDDQGIAKDARTLIQITRGRELLSQEDALAAGALAAGGLSAPEQQQFVELVGAQRFVFSDAAASLPVADKARYDAILNSPEYIRLHTLEETIVQGGQSSVTLAQWSAAIPPVLDKFSQIYVVGGLDLVGRATPVAVGVIFRLALAGGLGLIAVIASIVISITTARRLVRQLERLRTAANDLATYRLPRVVERLQHGDRVDVDAESPPLDFGRDEIGQVGEAFNAVQQQAVRVAVEQAELRRSVRDVFLSLARRSQALLHRQLGLLDAMERRTTDAEELAELFRVDHLATRMRRNAENLIVLSGATAGRAWRKPVPMVDVLRGALAEVEDYTRVTVTPVGNASLLGRAVGDVIHLLAELIENAVSFSPPQTTVRVGGSAVGNGYAIEIEDRGLGMSVEELEYANEQLREPPEFKLTSTARLGLYVVGQLALRHGIRVRLTESPYGGTTAIVLLPATIMFGDGIDGSDDRSVEPERTAALVLSTGRHRHENVAARQLASAGYGQATVAPELEDAQAADPWRSFVSTAGGEAEADAAPGEAGGRPPEPTVLTPSGLPFRQRDPGTGPRSPAPVSPVPMPIAPISPAPSTVVPPPPAPVPLQQRPVGAEASTPATSNGTPTNGSTANGAGHPRAPEDVRSMMASYRSGTLRGRNEAARLTEDEPSTSDTSDPTALEPEPRLPGTDEGG